MVDATAKKADAANGPGPLDWAAVGRRILSVAAMASAMALAEESAPQPEAGAHTAESVRTQ